MIVPLLVLVAPAASPVTEPLPRRPPPVVVAPPEVPPPPASVERVRAGLLARHGADSPDPSTLLRDGGAEGLRWLARFDPRAFVRVRALRALAADDAPATTAVCVEAASHGLALVRAGAASCLRDRLDEQAVRAVDGLRGDADPRVRAALGG